MYVCPQDGYCSRPRTLVLVVLVTIFSLTCLSAQDSLSVGPGSAPPGGTAALNLTLNSPAGSEPMGVQWTFSYPSSSVSSITVTPAPGTNGSVACAGSSGLYTCVETSPTTMVNGPVAVATVQLSAAATGSVAVNLTNTYGALGSGSAVGLAGTGGSITVLSSASLGSLSCSPTSLTPPGSVSCTVALTSFAPTGGTSVALSSNSASLAVPGSVVVPAGASSATFTGTASAVSVNTTAVVTATYSAVSKTASEQLLAVALSSFTCSPTVFTPPLSVSCTVALSGPAPTGGAIITLSSNNATLTVPASVQIAAGATSATVTAQATAVTVDTTAVLTATYAGASKTASETLLGPMVLTSLSCVPSSLTSGGKSTCTASLNKAATSAVSVTVSSNNSAVAVPTSTSIAAGATSVAFTAQAGTVAATQSATITATAAGASVTAAITVSPAVAGKGAYVQSGKYTNDGSSTAVSASLPVASTAGNTLIAVVSWGDADASALSATDNAGNVYTIATRDFDSGNRQGLAILYASNAKSGATTTTVSLGTSAGYRRMIILEYSGLLAVDVTAKNISTATTAQNAVTSTGATTTAAGELVFGAVMDDYSHNNITAGTGFTQRSYTNNKDLACQDLIQAQTGSVASTQTFSKKDRYLAQMVTFKTQ